MSEPTVLDKVLLACVVWPLVVASTAKRLVTRLFVCSWRGHAWAGRRWCSRCELWA